MKLTLTDEGDNYLIRSYDSGAVVINEHRHTRSLIVTPKQVIDDWPPQTFAELTPEHFFALSALEPQLVILGTGSKQEFPDPALYATLLEQGIGVEIMATSAACRTYNILVAEGRNVAAALLLY